MGQDWTVIYQAMSAINFNSYDYDSIRQALIDYIRINYPEDFNDWIDSSEFVSIIELLAYLASSLAFRIDLNTRENFLDTATRRDSVLRLARMLSYNPRRCVAAQGFVKLTQVITDQTIYDSNGVNLANVPIIWNDANNPDWFEQFVLVLNAAFVKSNPYGQPVKSGKVANVLTQRYDFDNVATTNTVQTFYSTINGTSTNFEFVNADFVVQQSGSIAIGSNGYFLEKTPSIYNPWSIIYRSDGNGNASANTGFFIYFKQGTFSSTDFLLDTPVPNRVIDINAININQSDVWVQTVNDLGVPLYDWTRVPALPSSNLVYNSLGNLTRDIFQVITTDNNGDDSVSIKFGDGYFGNIPSGRIRVSYRTSNNLTYTILPNDMTGLNLNLSYVSAPTAVNTLSMTLDLANTVANALARESSDSVRQRASAVFYTQNRMVNGEDYNLFPLQSSEALKIKAVNRTYSGQSRYIDINDPTSSYSNTKVFSDDGILFVQEQDSYWESYASTNLTAAQIIGTYIQPLIEGTAPGQLTYELRDFYIDNYPRTNPVNTYWYNTATLSNSTSEGNFYKGVQTNLSTASPLLLPDTQYGMDTNSYLKFADGTWSYLINDGNTIQTNYLTVIDKKIPDVSLLKEVVPAFRSILSSDEISAITDAINQKRNFGITYVPINKVTVVQPLQWVVISASNLAVDAPFNLSTQGDNTNANLDASWLIQMKYVSGQGWQIRSRGIQYVFESLNDVRFYFINSGKVTDAATGLTVQDQIRVLSVNTQPTSSAPLGEDYYWSLQGQQVYADGYVDPRRVRVAFWDSNGDGIVDNPDQFIEIVAPNRQLPVNSSNQIINPIDPTVFPYVFWQSVQVSNYSEWQPFVPTRIYSSIFDMNAVHPLGNAVWQVGDVVYVQKQNVFLEYVSSSVGLVDVSNNHMAEPGRSGISYCWQHYVDSNQRIDPAIMNVIDVYVLTSAYDTSMRNWIAKGSTLDPMPTAPTPDQLRMDFQQFENYKMMTDQLVWHPVSYKLLFGSAADPVYQVVFKVVKVQGAAITDSELKSRIIQNIDNYFSINYWDFGQSFYFTELSAYIHQQNPSTLASVVIVPLNANARFGDLFQITCDPDEIFISCAKVTDIQIVQSLTSTELRQA